MPNLDLLLRPPGIFLILGVISFSAAVVWTCIGKAWVRFDGWIYRAKEPNWFWWEVALYYLCGVGLIGYFLYKVN
jgi:H+/Cl- antiporter ClcA